MASMHSPLPLYRGIHANTNANSNANGNAKKASSGTFQLQCLKPFPKSLPGLQMGVPHSRPMSMSMTRTRSSPCHASPSIQVIAKNQGDPIKIMIAGAPASGKGSQCELIVQKFGLVHISAGDLLRAEVKSGSENGIKAQEFMNKGQLVPDEIIIKMIKERLAQPDVAEKGWLLDGFPRTVSQADAFEAINVRPDLFIQLDVSSNLTLFQVFKIKPCKSRLREILWKSNNNQLDMVPDKILVERVVGRRLDPVTNKIYHLKHSPPENEAIASRLIQRSDDTEDKVKVRIQTYKQNTDAILSKYERFVKKVDGNRPKQELFYDIEKLILNLASREGSKDSDLFATSASTGSPESAFELKKENWKGIPTRLNSIPHSKEIRQYFYKDVCEATKRAVADGILRLKVQLTIPELNPEMDVYRIGTLLELIRELAFVFANDGKRVRVCVQGSMGEGIFSGIPLQLAGTRRLLENMDWGDYDAKGTFINIGSVGAKEVLDEDDIFILMAPQNAVGNCIIDDLQGMVNAIKERPIIIVNPRLKDLPSASGVMQIRGREKRMEFADTFFTCYNFKLLYYSGSQYPILGALRLAYPSQYEVYKREDLESGNETYVLLGTFNEEPNGSQIQDAFSGRLEKRELAAPGIWSFLSMLF